jgi:DNA-binding NarL/FixJ family response regulator
MNPSSPRRLTVVEIREPLTRLEAEYQIYREAAERYHANTQKILKNVLDKLSKAKLRETLAASQMEAAAPPSAKSGKVNSGKFSKKLAPLTRRETEVLALIASGSSTKQVASQLGITFKTAVGHRSSLMKRLSIHDTASLVRYAIRAGLIEA